MQLSELIKNCQPQAIHGKTEIAAEITIDRLAYDSRLVKPGSLFFCLRGGKIDGHHFIHSAIGQGAIAIVCEELPKNLQPNICYIQVADSRLALSQLSAAYYKQPSSSLTLIGITGTNGKTTLSYLLESILTVAKLRVGVIGTINYRTPTQIFPAVHTTPESLELQGLMQNMLNHEISHIAMEVSSHALTQARVNDCHFDVAVLTNITQDHLDYHGNMANYIRSKARLFALLAEHGKGVKAAVINADDPNCAPILETLRKHNAIKLLTFGYSQIADYRVSESEFHHNGFTASISEKSSSTTQVIKSHLPGRHNLSNCLAAVAVSRSLGLDWSIIEQGIRALTHVPGRLECLSTDQQVSIYIDYAHTEDALRNVLQAMQMIRTEAQGGRGRIITLFGCGGNRDKHKRPRMGEAVISLSDLTIVTSDNPRHEEPLQIIKEITSSENLSQHLVSFAEFTRLSPDKKPLATVLPDRREAIQLALSIAINGDLILIAGKGHEDYQEIRGQRLPFSDRIICQRELTRMGWKIVSA